MASLTTAIEKTDSWQWIATADGNEEFTLRFYAPWDEVYGPKGSGYRFAEFGDILVTGDGAEDERLRLTRMMASPSENDKEGCLFEQVYTSNNKSLKGKVPDLRSSWRASFNTSLIARDETKQIGSTVGTYDGSAVTTTDGEGNIKPQTVYVPETTYNVSFNASELDLAQFTTKIGKVNSVNFFTQHREVQTGDQRILDAGGNILFQSDTDVNLWLFSYFIATETGVKNYEVTMEFKFNPAGWNGNPDTMYITTDTTDCFVHLFDKVKKLYRPDGPVPGRS